MRHLKNRSKAFNSKNKQPLRTILLSLIILSFLPVILSGCTEDTSAAGINYFAPSISFPKFIHASNITEVSFNMSFSHNENITFQAISNISIHSFNNTADTYNQEHIFVNSTLNEINITAGDNVTLLNNFTFNFTLQAFPEGKYMYNISLTGNYSALQNATEIYKEFFNITGFFEASVNTTISTTATVDPDIIKPGENTTVIVNTSIPLENGTIELDINGTVYSILANGSESYVFLINTNLPPGNYSILFSVIPENPFFTSPEATIFLNIEAPEIIKKQNVLIQFISKYISIIAQTISGAILLIIYFFFRSDKDIKKSFRNIKKDVCIYGKLLKDSGKLAVSGNYRKHGLRFITMVQSYFENNRHWGAHLFLSTYLDIYEKIKVFYLDPEKNTQPLKDVYFAIKCLISYKESCFLFGWHFIKRSYMSKHSLFVHSFRTVKKTFLKAKAVINKDAESKASFALVFGIHMKILAIRSKISIRQGVADIKSFINVMRLVKIFITFITVTLLLFNTVIHLIIPFINNSLNTDFSWKAEGTLNPLVISAYLTILMYRTYVKTDEEKFSENAVRRKPVFLFGTSDVAEAAMNICQRLRSEHHLSIVGEKNLFWLNEAKDDMNIFVVQNLEEFGRTHLYRRISLESAKKILLFIEDGKLTETALITMLKVLDDEKEIILLKSQAPDFTETLHLAGKKVSVIDDYDCVIRKVIETLFLDVEQAPVITCGVPPVFTGIEGKIIEHVFPGLEILSIERGGYMIHPSTVLKRKDVIFLYVHNREELDVFVEIMEDGNGL